MKERRTEPPPCKFNTLEGWRTSVEQVLRAVAGAPRKLKGPELEAGRECYETIKDKLGVLQVAFEVPDKELKVEGPIERRRRFNIKVRTAVAHGAGAAWDAADLQIPKIMKLANEIKDLFLISTWKHQLQGLYGAQKRPEIFFHFWIEGMGIQRMDHEALEVREGVELPGVGVQTVSEEQTIGDDREVKSMLEEAALTQGP